MQFDEHLCDISQGFNWHGASRGPSVIAELLVHVSHVADTLQAEMRGIISVEFILFYVYEISPSGGRIALVYILSSSQTNDSMSAILPPTE